MFSPTVLAAILGSGLVCSCLAQRESRALRAEGSAPLIYEQPTLLTASIYARKSDPAHLLFTFRRTASRSGSIIHVLREYLYPDGRAAARERVVYEGNSLKSYELEELQTGSSGTVNVSDDPRDRGRLQVAFEYSKDSSHVGRTRLATEPANSEPLVNDMMGAFLSANYESLAKGIKVSCRYIVVSRKEIVGLSFTKESETTYFGHDAIILKLQPTSRLISLLVDPLYFTVEKAQPHRVLEYIGRTTPKINEAGRWKDLDAVTVFHW